MHGCGESVSASLELIGQFCNKDPTFGTGNVQFTPFNITHSMIILWKLVIPTCSTFLILNIFPLLPYMHTPWLGFSLPVICSEGVNSYCVVFLVISKYVAINSCWCYANTWNKWGVIHLASNTQICVGC